MNTLIAIDLQYVKDYFAGFDKHFYNIPKTSRDTSNNMNNDDIVDSITAVLLVKKSINHPIQTLTKRDVKHIE